MKSGRQRATEIKQKRAGREGKKRAAALRVSVDSRLLGVGPEALVNASALAMSGLYEPPDFAKRGFYEDQNFECRDCGKAEVWKATQQKWWYEVAKGDVRTVAVRCRSCRRRERARRAEAREVHLDGLARKRGST